jgi:transcriptional regulator
MYVPSAFAEADRDKLHDFIAANSFALLISTRDGEPFATHLPLLLERGAGEHGRLIGHMARANPQWRGLDGEPVLAIFSGPHAYISPSWYEAENVVPTWNYVAVHAYGTFRLVDDAETARIVSNTVGVYESGMPQPWSIDTATEFFQNLVRAVVGFRIEITRIEGKWKLNQNHPEERRQKVVRALENAADPDAREIARLMWADVDPAMPGKNL